VLAFVIQRLLQACVVMMVISALVFIGVYAVGNPIDVMIAPDVTQEIRAQTIRAYGFDQPLWHQYATFLQRLASGDFGRSFVYNMPVLSLILSRLPATMEITLAAVLGATLIGIPLGMFAGYAPHGRAAKTIMGLSVLGFSVAAVSLNRNCFSSSPSTWACCRPADAARPCCCSESTGAFSPATASSTCCCHRSTWRCSRWR